MSRDPRSLPRALKRRVRSAAARAGGVHEVRADLERARADLKETRARHRRTKDALRTAKEGRDSARGRVRELEDELRERTEELRTERERRRAAAERATGLGYAHRRLRSVALGYRSPRDLGPAPGRAPEGEEREQIERELRWLHVRSLFARSLAHGEGLEGAFATLIRNTHGPQQLTEARQLAPWLHDHGPDPEPGHLATGLVAAGPAAPLPPQEGSIAFGVLGYDQPDPRNASRNIGDHVQTVASLAHLVRHTGARFDGGDLGRFATDLADRVPVELRVDSPE